PDWSNGSAARAGAVTFGNGTSGVTGVVSAANSLVGSTTNDGPAMHLFYLNNGNYLVINPFWTNGTAIRAGEVTFGNGTSGTSGVISAANSLVGAQPNDQVGIGDVTVLNNENYLVFSPSWSNGTAASAGAVTFGSGTSGINGVISAGNSLVGV